MGLLAAVGTAMSALVAFAHGYLTWMVLAAAAVAAGLVTYLTANKKTLVNECRNWNSKQSSRVNLARSDRMARPPGLLETVSSNRRFAARLSGLASGLALAVRPAGLAEVSGAQGWVLKIVSAKRLETLFGCP